MVETRRKRRERDDDDEEGGDDAVMLDSGILSPEEAELALEEAKKSRSQKAKQRRIESFARNRPPFELLTKDVLPVIFLYLDSARDVYNFASCAGYLRKCLTPEIIIRSAVFSGGKTREAIGTIAESVKNKSIHVPSTSRLLRLVNGAMCERGDQCFAYDLVKNVSETLEKSGKRPFGLNICPTCVRCTSTSLLTSSDRDNLFTANERVETYDYSRLLCQPYEEAVTGDPIGPFVLGTTVKQIQKSYSDPADMERALGQFFRKVDENTTADSAARVEEIWNAYELAESEYDAHEEAKLNIFLRKQNERESARSSKRREKAQAVYAKLETLLDDYALKNFVLKCTWGPSGYCHFEYPLIDESLGPLLRAPSTATMKKLASAVDTVQDLLDLLHSHGFISSSDSGFLSFLATEERQYAKALYRYCCANANTTGLLDMTSDSLAEYDFVGFLREGKPFEALLSMTSSTDIGDAFIQSVVKDRDEEERKKQSKLAKKVWSQYVRKFDDVATEAKFRSKFYLCKREYRILKAAIRDYKAEPRTVEFVQETDPPRHRPNQSFTRQNAVDTAYDSSASIRFLQERNFASLLSLHKAVFQNPGIYGFPSVSIPR